ncbi:MAG TPA: cytochrome c-type biogenesis protein CcmH [Gemmatimonadales bacterium]|nr:cytochrome c-type biogenesis protein CcmH [Gemmatimonadales bacterium]
MIDRRRFLALGAVALVPAVLRAQDEAPAVPVAPDADPLRDPFTVGRVRDSLTAMDSDAVIIALERRLRCTCGCTLDIYTCRTTDFTCTFSPALHKEIVALYTAGQTPEQIIATFVAREGESILMAPPAEGFNLTGYLLPGLLMAAGLLGLIAWIMRRKAPGAVPTPAATGPTATRPDEDQLAELRRALDEVDA